LSLTFLTSNHQPVYTYLKGHASTPTKCHGFFPSMPASKTVPVEVGNMLAQGYKNFGEGDFPIIGL